MCHNKREIPKWFLHKMSANVCAKFYYFLKNIFFHLKKGFCDRQTELPVLFGWRKKFPTRNE
jgi:hypothetical protein